MSRPRSLDIGGTTVTPQTSTRGRTLTGGWGWLALLRIGLGVTMGLYAVTYQAAAGHPGPRYLRPAALGLAAVPLLLAAAQLTSGRRSSRLVAMAGFVGDAMAVLGTLALYAFDPRRYLLALVIVVQAEGGVVLGIAGGILAWVVTTGGYITV